MDVIRGNVNLEMAALRASALIPIILAALSLNGLVKNIVEVIEELNSLARSAHRCQLCEAHDVPEEKSCAVMYSLYTRVLNFAFKNSIAYH